VTKGSKSASPEVGGGARLHADQARRQTPEEGEDLSPADLAADESLPILIDAVDLKDVLGDVETNRGDLHRTGSLSGAEAITLLQRAMAGSRRRPPHHVWSSLNARSVTVFR
jgi:hypothetical protein